MNRNVILTEEASRKFAQWVASLFVPISVICTPGLGQTAISEFKKWGLLTALPVDALKSKQKWDALAIFENEINDDSGDPTIDFAQLLGKVDWVFLLRSPERDTPKNAVKILFENGFVHEFIGDERISSEWNLMSFHRELEESDRFLDEYEDEIRRLSQLEGKQRDLLLKFREEMANETMRLEGQVQRLEGQVQSLENHILEREREIQREIQAKDQIISFHEYRWIAFQNSRTGRMINRLQRLRQVIIPHNSGREKFGQFIFRNYRLLKTEGMLSYLVALPGRLARKIHWQLTKYTLRFSLREEEHQIVDIEPIKERPIPSERVQDVDIIICVHNALEDVKRCLASIEENTIKPYQLILVDDGSADETARFLSNYSLSHGVTLIRSDQATGYTFAANRGLRESSAEFVVLLNSDTIVTEGWVDRMVNCANSDPTIGIVGPLSNTASWQSVPKIEENGDWATNPLPEGVTIAAMGKMIVENSAKLYPDLPLLNGFCLMIRRKVIEDIGFFDEENFGPGYGEEDDFTLRARKAGWKLALADDTYIYHAQSKSYSSERRKALAENAGRKLAAKHGESIVHKSVSSIQENRILRGIRARAAVAVDRRDIIRQGNKYTGKRILFVLPVTTPGGGANVIRTESLAMRKFGIDVEFFNLRGNRVGFEQAYPNFEFPVTYGEIQDLRLLVNRFDAVIATYNPTVEWIMPIYQNSKFPRRGYYVQGFEPLMYPPGNADYNRALKSYTLFSDLVCFTKTAWTQKQVFENTGQNCRIVGVSLDIDLYRPRWSNLSEATPQPLRIAAMIRPEAPYREPAKTMELLRKAAESFKGEIEICIFGTNIDNPGFLELPHDFRWKLYGVLPQEKVANFLSRMDIFVDYSSHQAMGLTALEAMSCGCAVIVPEYGGTVDFAQHECNSLIVDTSSFEEVWKGLQKLVTDNQLRAEIQHNAIFDACKYFPEKAALNIMVHLFED